MVKGSDILGVQSNTSDYKNKENFYTINDCKNADKKIIKGA